MSSLRKALGYSVLVLFVASALAPAVDAQSQQGSVDVAGTIAGPPPATAPTIDEPEPGTTFTDQPITVQGRCQADLVVKIFRNKVFAGSAVCQADSSYSLNVELVKAQNDLVAIQYDMLDQASPDSETITVFYSPSPPSLEAPTQPSVAASFPLVIDYNYAFQGVFADETFHLPIHFVGGTGPFAVNIDWGDGNSDLYSRQDAAQFFADHAYKNAGAYSIKLQISDSRDQHAYLQFVLIVNGKVANVVPVGIGATLQTAPAIVTVGIGTAAGFGIGTAVSFFGNSFVAVFHRITVRFRRPKS